MYSSPLSTLTSTVSTIEKLNTVGVTELKQKLWDHLNIANERQFLSKFLVFAFDRLPHETMNDLHTECSTIASRPECTESQGSDGREEKKNLKLLRKDEIGHLSTFLTKKECISLGQVNRHFYIETQTKSFILNHRRSKSQISHKSETSTLELDIHRVRALCTLPKAGGFAYWFPCILTFQDSEVARDKVVSKLLQVTSHMHQKHLWTSLFSSLYSLDISSNSLFDFIPVSTLFNRELNNNKPLVLLKIKHLCKAALNSFAKFAAKYADYFESEKCRGDISNIRHIEKLDLSESCVNVAQFLKSLKGNYTDLSLTRVRLEIDEKKECLESIFHPRLRSLTTDAHSVFFGKRVRSVRPARKGMKLQVGIRAEKEIKPCKSLKSLTILTNNFELYKDHDGLADMFRYWTLFRHVECLTLQFSACRLASDTLFVERRNDATPAKPKILDQVLHHCRQVMKCAMKTFCLRMTGDYVRKFGKKIRLGTTGALLLQLMKWKESSESMQIEKSEKSENKFGVQMVKLEWELDHMLFIYHDVVYDLTKDAQYEDLKEDLKHQQCDDGLDRRLEMLFGARDNGQESQYPNMTINIESGLKVLRRNNVKTFLKCIDGWLLRIAKQQRKNVAVTKFQASVCIELENV